VSELKSPGKPFEISKAEVLQAWEKVKANKGAPGVDGCSIEEFEADLKNNLYKVWNRMSSGSYFPPPVRAVEIPKSHGGGTRILGVPTVADRVAQTVVARRLETRVEEIFHPDSYGYRPGRAARDAVEVCRRRCWSIYPSALYRLLARINAYLVRWIRNKYRRYDKTRAARRKFAEITSGYPRLFRHWRWVTSAW